ncbi:MAG: hypothetical protein V2I48_16485 [Xanthomonadales bacterium]|jgi:hypothetical protein|nr:hypothetical protein [Xanthomonadales bacterium]
MFKILRNGAITVLMVLMLSAIAEAQQTTTEKTVKPTEKTVAELEQLVSEAYAAKNWVRVYSNSMKLHKQRPFVPGYMVNIVLASAALDQKRTAYHYMLKMQQQGLSYDFNQYEETTAIRDTEAYEYINDLMVKAGDPSGEGAKILSLNLKPLDLGDIAWDGSRDQFLVGTRLAGKLLAVGDNGQSEVLLEANDENGLWSIDGLAVDTSRNRLWIASSATPAFVRFVPTDAGHGALFEFELDSLKPVGRYNLAVDGLRHELGGVALTAAGDVYVVDRATPIIYRKAAAGKRLEVFAGGPQLVALTDIAVTPDNSRVFVADAVLGILLIDPGAQRSAMLSGPENLNLFGIYGIQFSGEELVVTQSGLSPQRIMRLQMNAEGTTVETVSPMASGIEGFDTPGVGTIRGGSLYYFANHGSPDADADLVLMATPLAAGNEVKAPDLRQFEEALRKKAGEQ